MAAWDCEAVLEKYAALLPEDADEATLRELFGTPTKIAIDLARDYTPTPPPMAEVPAEDTAEDAVAVADEDAVAAIPAEVFGEEISPVEAPAAAKKKAKLRTGGMIVYVLGLVLIGLPIAVVLIALGVPFLLLGGGLIAAAASLMAGLGGALTLISDLLLALGGALGLGALGLVLAWLGLWISLELGWLWLGRLVFPLGGKLCRRKEAEADG